MTRPGTLFVLLLLLAAPAFCEVIPPESRPHAARMDQWRTMLDAADEALRGERPQEAERIYTEVIAAAETLEKVNLLVARAIDALADLRAEQGRLSEAQALYRRAAKMWGKLLGPRQPRLAITLHNLAVVELALDRPEEARGHVLAALEIWELSLGSDSAQAQQSRALRERVAARLNQERGDAEQAH
jgi:tetratricopeptide (TPR) repeat protein